MRRGLLLLAAFIPFAAAAKNVKERDANIYTSQVNYTQLLDQSTQNDSEKGVSTRTGSFSIDEAPVEVNLLIASYILIQIRQKKFLLIGVMRHLPLQTLLV